VYPLVPAPRNVQELLIRANYLGYAASRSAFACRAAT